MVIIFYDIETTGFSRERNDIIEIAAVAWDNETEEVLEKWSTYIKPNSNIPAKITQLTGISNASVRNSPRYWDVIPEFFAWIRNFHPTYMVGYNNAVFDWPFIKAQNERYQININDDWEQLDIYRKVKEYDKRGLTTIKATMGNQRQISIAKYFGIQYEAHDAIDDVEALTKIYARLRAIDPQLP